MLVCQTIPNRNTRVSGKCLYPGVIKTSVFDGIKHTPEDSGTVFKRFLVTKLCVTGSKIHCIASKIGNCNLESTARPGRCLLKYQSYISTFKTICHFSLFLHLLEPDCQIKQIHNLG